MVDKKVLKKGTDGYIIEVVTTDQLISDTVTASATKDIETIVATTKRVIKWIVYFSTTSKEQTMEVMALNTISGMIHSISNVLGDQVAALIDVKIVTTDIVFEVTNNEAETLNVELLRLSI